jgi:membrane dipeptidase
LPRAVDGDFAGGFFAIFVPPKPAPKSIDKATVAIREADNVDLTGAYVDGSYAQRHTNKMMALLFDLERESDGQLKVVRQVGELRDCLLTDKVAAILHFEGAECIEPDLSNLTTYYQAGLRSLGFTWSRPNAFGWGVPFKHPHSPDTGPGLTTAGKELVRECNHQGIMIDLSHLNEKGFWDVHKLSDSPLVATHATVHAICPSTRNLTDSQIDAIGESGGLIGINFHVGFLRPDGRSDPDTPLTEIVRHLDYVVDRIGIDHVAFGSDFDGAKMPAELGDVSGLPKLLNTLRESGYDETDLRKLAQDNWVRVLEQSWKK